MDAFETVVAEVLWRDGYWVQNAVKVDLTKDDKLKINRRFSPRWELDIVGYSAERKEVLVVECKSYLDSRGVTFKAVNGSDQRRAGRYKLFNDDVLRDVVLDRLSCQMVEGGLVPKRHETKLALVCGNIASDQDRQALRQHFHTRGWLLWDDVWLRKKLASISQSGYENSPVAVVSKLLLRGSHCST